jgi:phage tail protein X
VEIQPWNGGLDPICTYTAQQQLVDELDALGYRYVARTTTDSHAILAGNDAFAGVMADFFDHTTLARDPAHVTYVFNSEMDEPRFGMNADHAYWLSGLTLADPAAGTQGTIDVVSHGFGVGDPEPQPTQYSAGALTGGALAPVVAYEQQSKTWGPVPAAPTADVLEITASDIATVTIDAVRARVSCNAEIRVHTDHPLAVTLSGCGPAQQFG